MSDEGDLSTLIRTPTSEPTIPSEVCLTAVFSPDTNIVGTRVPLPQPTEVLAIGRDVAGGWSVRDPHLSRLHLRIAHAATTTYHLGDAGSANGTVVNGRPTKSHQLTAGDVVRIGDTLLVADDAANRRSFDDLLERMARAPLPVLILGETGSGKEVTARRLHAASGRTGRFLAVNCAAFTADLLGSELFGHVRGAFSGAARDRQGLFASAEGGTLFLDEIGDLPTDLQPALLRALEEGQVRPLGSDRYHEVDVRVLAATNQDVSRDATRQPLRRDLYARLAQLVLHVAPLRQRRGSILELSAEFAREQGTELTLSADAAEALLLHDYPENVRELQSIIRTFVVVGGGQGELDREYLAKHRPELLDAVRDSPRPGGSGPDRDRRSELRSLLQQHAGNVSAVAEALGKPRAQIYRWVRSLGLRVEDYRRDSDAPPGER